jgi:hypothetical protein
VAELDTQNIDPVAESGVRYANVHTTALCSSTRSYILTGRNHHSNGMAHIMGLATGYPGYDGRMPFENGMLPEMLGPKRLQRLLPWQVAPVAVGGQYRRRPVPPLVPGPGVRTLLRLGSPDCPPHPYLRFVVAVPTAPRAVPICVAGATRLLDETPCNVVAVRLGDESWLRISPVGPGGAPCGAGDGASRPVRATPTPREARWR